MVLPFQQLTLTFSHIYYRCCSVLSLMLGACVLTAVPILQLLLCH